MNRRNAIRSVVLGAATAVPGARAAASKALQVLVDRWEKAKAFTLQVADAMPGESYDFKPHPDMRSYGELMRHIAANNAFYIARFRDGKIPASLDPPKQMDKEATKEYLAASFEFCAGVLKSVSEGDLDKSYPGRPNTPDQTGWDWVLHAFIHTAHHRGYAEVYLREKNITPPRYAV
jgi:uncharacterized damage-inducible protein DinB